MKCSCGSRDIDFQESSGHAVCCKCGRIIEENAIVSAIEFEETGERSRAIGQLVGADGRASRTGQRKPYMSSGESRELTLANARRVIQQVAVTLRLSMQFVDPAYRLYNKALQLKFMYGRQQIHVVAVCLYTVCRLEKSPHLLIDFSDALQVNVYVLGRAFMHLSRLLCLQDQLRVIDPGLYLRRFASKLELGDKLNAIVTTSLRLVTRLKKDWIAAGRRPDGICAAAVLISCRCHGVNKGQGEIAKLFRISCDTLQHRLQEFRQTPIAQLTVQEFATLTTSNLEISDHGEFDPPSFIRGQHIERERLEEALDDIDVANESNQDVYSGESDHEQNSMLDVSYDDIQSKVSQPTRKLSVKRQSKALARQYMYQSVYSEVQDDNKDECFELEKESMTILDNLTAKNPDLDLRGDERAKITAVVSIGSSSSHRPGDNNNSSSSSSLSQNDPSLITNDFQSEVDPSFDVSEYVLSPEEQAKKSAIFQRTYGGYLLERDLRRQEKEKAKKQELDSAAPKKRGRKRDAKHLESTSSSSSSNPASRNDSNSSLSYPVAGMNDRNLLSVSRKPSKKINYEALEEKASHSLPALDTQVTRASSVSSDHVIKKRIGDMGIMTLKHSSTERPSQSTNVNPDGPQPSSEIKGGGIDDDNEDDELLYEGDHYDDEFDDEYE